MVPAVVRGNFGTFLNKEGVGTKNGGITTLIKKMHHARETGRAELAWSWMSSLKLRFSNHSFNDKSLVLIPG